MSSGGSDICIYFLSFSEGGGGRRGEEGGAEGGGGGGGGAGLEENKCKMKAFLRATKELHTGKELGEHSMGLKNTQTKLGKEEGMSLQWHRAPCLVQRASQNIQKEEESETQNGNDGPAGKYSSRSEGGEWDTYWAKGHRVFSSIHLKTERAAQAGAVILHLGVEWILSRSSERAHRRSLCGPMLKVRPKGLKAVTGWERQQMNRVGGKGSESER